ncbi:hypothetical protein [Sulfuricurvum sp.]|uniref:InlB B-repeat-containing protein n=1 Tax=Sulfuricurvum sp. TaxID=2025608 RepID=UPI0035626316
MKSIIYILIMYSSILPFVDKGIDQGIDGCDKGIVQDSVAEGGCVEIPAITNPDDDTVYCHSEGGIKLIITGIAPDSLHWILKPDSMIFVGADSIHWWATKVLIADTVKFSAHNSCGIDTGFFIRKQVWDTLHIDSVQVWYLAVWHKLIKGDTIYRSDSLFRHLHSNGWNTLGGWNWPGIHVDSLYTGDSADVRGDSTQYGIAARVHSSASTGWAFFTVSDTGGGEDTLKTGGEVDSFYIAAYDTATITLDPHDTTVSDGDTVIYHVTVSGSRGPVRKWQFYDGSWSDTAGVTGDTLKFVASTGRDGDSVRCIVSNDRGADTSVAAVLNIAVTIWTLTVADAGNGSTDPEGPTAVEDGVATNITATSDAHYGFVRWTRSTTDIAIADSTDSTTMATASGAGIVTAYFDLDSVTVTLGITANGTITSPCPDQIFAFGETDTVIFTPAANYRVVGATDKLPDTSIFQPTADTMVDTAFELFPTYTIDTTEAEVGLGTWAIAGGLTQDSGVTVVYSASPTSGWSFVRYGGTFTGTSAIDSFVIAGNHTDSVIFSIVPIIDSVKAHTRRDLNRISCARRLDTVTFITTTDIYDSTDQSAVFIGRDTTGQMAITRWFNSGSGLDSIWAIVPADATANKNFRPILRNGYGICSNVRTPVTWREPWILNVKVMVP